MTNKLFVALVLMFSFLGLYCEVDKTLIVNLDADSAMVSEVPGPSSVDVSIRRLWQILKEKGVDDAVFYAKQKKIPLDVNGQLQVIISERSSISKTSVIAPIAKLNSEMKYHLIETKVNYLGGRVLCRLGDQVHCRIPLENVLLMADGDVTLYLPIRMRSHVVSEGVETIEAGKLQNLTPFRGADVKVCVLDLGFENSDLVKGSELPQDFTVVNFRDDGVTNEGIHGTACAEIVHDIVPDAQIYGATVLYITDIIPAADWMIQNDIDVISSSLGHFFGPGDGTGFENYAAHILKQNGIQYVTSAGNEGDVSWNGSFSDSDADGWHNFASDDEILAFYVPGYYTVSAALKWNDWGAWSDDQMDWAGASQDFDLYLWYQHPQTKEWILISEATSDNRQPQYKYPYEGVGYYYLTSSSYWGVSIRKHQASRNVFFNLSLEKTNASHIQYAKSDMSLSMPADSPNIIAVGATDALTDDLETYSSRGPTLDGRIKPDVTAPSHVTTSSQTYGPRGFSGTSASCPHMAGLIALFKSRTPYSVDQIVNMIYARVLNLGAEGFDNLFGRGRIRVGGQ